jgi:DNA-binding transcriptional ArsR family regulator
MPEALLRAVLEPRRREILRLIWTEEKSAGEIHRAVGAVTFGAISQHLKVLKAVGAVHARQDGRQRFYRARHEGLGPLKRSLEAMWRESPDRLRVLAETEQRHSRQRRKRRS